MDGVITICRNWFERRQVMRELRHAKADLRESAYFRVKDYLTHAQSALMRNDNRHATEMWDKALECSPHDTRDSSLALDVLIGLRRFDEAETIMRDGQARKPSDMRFATGLAEVAAARGDDETALLGWAAVRKRFPHAMEGYAAGTRVLRKLNRLPEAEALAEQTMRQFPEEVRGFMEHAQIAATQESWEASLQRWDVVRAKFNHPSSYIGAGRAMTKLGRYDEAEAMLASARIRAPTEYGPFIELARCAEARGDIPTAVARWKRLAHVFALHLPSCLTAAAGLEALGATEDAEAVLREAVDHFPAEPAPIERLGMLLGRCGQTDTAVETFAVMRQTFPDNRIAYSRLAEALSKAGRPAEAAAIRDEIRGRFENPTAA